MTEATSDIISAELLELLVCPIDHGTLEVVDSALRCTTCGRTYPVEDGVPNMLVEDE